MTARVMAFASPKGGAGKTVLSASFGTILARAGKRVLLIDADAATNGLTLLFLPQVVASSRRANYIGLFEGPSEQLPQGFEIEARLFLVPATFGFRNTENAKLDVFRSRLSQLVLDARHDVDYVFIDAQAGVDPFAGVAVSADISDDVIVVTEYDPMSAAGVERLKAIFSDSLDYSRTWVLLNKVLPDFAKSYGDFLEVIRYASPIPWSADVVRAYARRALPVADGSWSTHTLALVRSLRSVLGPEASRELDEWVDSNATALRAPLDDEIRYVEQELNALRIVANRRTRNLLNRAGASALGFAVAFGAAVLNIAKVLSTLPAVITFIASATAGLACLAAAFSYRTRVVESDSERIYFRTLQRRLEDLIELRYLSPEEFLSQSGTIRLNSRSLADGIGDRHRAPG